jgi:hypothetical protein
MLPGLGIESLNNWANLQFLFAYGLAWLLLVPPERSNRIVAPLFAFAALGSGVIGLCVCPILLLHRRSALRHPALLGLAGAILYQAVAVLSTTVSLNGPPRHPTLSLDLTRDIAEATAAALVHNSGFAPEAEFWRLAVGALLAVAVLVIVASSSRRHVGLVVFGCGVLVAIAPSVSSGFTATRYTATGALLFVAALVIIVGSEEDRRPWGHWALVAVCLPWFFTLPVAAIRANVPAWNGEVSRARAVCASRHEDTTSLVELAVGPLGWGVAQIPCDRVT